jgi:hypothetical protein
LTAFNIKTGLRECEDDPVMMQKLRKQLMKILANMDDAPAIDSNDDSDDSGLS